MKKFIFEIEKIVNAIEKDANTKHYFLNGGCSHLANYLTPFFMKNNGFVEFALFIFYEEEWDRIQINKMIDNGGKSDVFLGVFGILVALGVLLYFLMR